MPMMHTYIPGAVLMTAIIPSTATMAIAHSAMDGTVTMVKMTLIMSQTYFDQASIHKDCEEGVHYSHEDNTWYCKDDGPDGTVDSNVYIHPDCSIPSYPVYYKNEDCQDDYGSECAFGEG